jgi:hypothetical protein
MDLIMFWGAFIFGELKKKYKKSACECFLKKTLSVIRTSGPTSQVDLACT